MSFYRCFCKDNVIFFFPCGTPTLPGITQIPRISWFLSVLKLSAGLTMHEKVPGENKGRTWNQTHSGPCSSRTGTAGRTGCEPAACTRRAAGDTHIPTASLAKGSETHQVSLWKRDLIPQWLWRTTTPTSSPNWYGMVIIQHKTQYLTLAVGLRLFPLSPSFGNGLL